MSILTPEVLEQARAARASGVPLVRIAERLGVTPNALGKALRREVERASLPTGPDVDAFFPPAVRPPAPAAVDRSGAVGQDPGSAVAAQSAQSASRGEAKSPEAVPAPPQERPHLLGAAPSAPVRVAPPPPQAPAVHTSRTRAEAYLIISDTQEPYSAPGALPFVLAVAREFGVDLSQPGSAYHVGDEVDFYNFSRFLRSPEAPHTPNQELAAVRERLAHWYAALPFLRLAKSNHGDRIVRRAADAGLPSQVLRAHRDILGAPEGWEWANEWRVPASKAPFLVEHGHHGGQSTAAARQRPAWNGISTTWGHMHAQAGVWHVKTHGQQVWGMCVGSLIDRDAVAFEYSKPNTWQPWLGVGVVLDGGRTPVLIPYGGDFP